MPLDASSARSLLSIQDWRSLSADSPEEAAAEFLSRATTRLGAGQVRAVFSVLPDARQLSRRLRAGVDCSGPLAGVPYVLKDLFDLKGYPTGAGSSFLASLSGDAPHDSVLVSALAARGAVCAGKTQLHEFAYGLTGENPFYGDIDNPARPGTTTGGSSSGSAAAVAAGVVPFAVGTDTGGSIRVPAAFCGLHGFRLTPRHPWIADAFPLSPRCDTCGWLTSSAADLLALNTALGLVSARTPTRALRGGFIDYPDMEPEAQVAWLRGVSFLGRHDNTTSSQLAPLFEGTDSAYSVITSVEAAQVHAQWLDARKSDYGPAVWARIDRGRRWTEADLIHAESVASHVRSLFASYFATFDYLAIPASPCLPLRHEDCASFDRNRILRLTAAASLAGLPVLSLPIAGIDGRPEGGIQVILPDAHSPVVPWLLGAGARG